MNKIRLDEILLLRGRVKDLRIAQSLIMQGLVYDKNQLLTKPGCMLKLDHPIFIKDKKSHNFVSRGGVKLDVALKEFEIVVQDKICVDIGCSTGGFTQVLLENGAQKVFAVDVAYGEFDYNLRQNDRVILYEKTNARLITQKEIYLKPNLIVCDVSFISVKLALSSLVEFVEVNTEFLVLIKPQFESSKGSTEKGIVKDENIWVEVCDDIMNWFQKEHNYFVCGIIPSSILGGKGNKEFFIYAIKQ